MRVVVTHKHAQQSERVRRALLGLGLECAPDDCVPFPDLPVRLAKGLVDLVLVNMSSEPAQALGAIQQAVGQTAVPVVAVGPTNDARQILQSTRSGAREYLDESRVEEDLEAVLERLRKTGAVKASLGKTIAVLSATPGAGVSSVATNLAFLWAQRFPQSVILTELGRDAPELALALDLDPPHSIVELVENWQRMDVALLRHSLAAHAGGVQLLSYLPEALSGEVLPPQAVRRALVLMRTNYPVSVLDLGHQFGEEHFEAIRLADHILHVVRLDVPGVRHARRLAAQLEELNLPPQRLGLVACRYGQKGQLPWKKAEEALGQKFIALLAEDSGNMNLALNQGQPVVRLAPRSAVARGFAKLADQLIPPPLEE